MSINENNALIWIAHGSKRVQSNQAVCDLVERLQPKLKHKFKYILPAFLELTEPKIQSQAKVLIEQGATSITLFPYFLAPGHHLVSDLPKIQSQLQALYPHCDIQLIDHLAELKNWDDYLVSALDNL